MKRIAEFIRNEKMLTAAAILALLSLLVSPLTGERIVSLPWNTLSSLLLLFISLEGFRKENLFSPLERMLGRIRSTPLLAVMLTLIVFVLSSLITNDVALLTFVPITIMMFRESGKDGFIMPLVIIETIAANLGSMLMPFGNPQNLYLFGRMDISASAFIHAMLPLWLISAVLIIASLLFIFRRDMRNRIYIMHEAASEAGNRSMKVLYICLFILTLLTILGAFSIFPILILTIAIVLLFDRETLKHTDWPLLATFLCFFIFSGSISSDERIAAMLSEYAHGHEFIIGLLLSQVISNVPSAILIEPFADSLRALLFGVDIGGLGTPVASLASLISLRLLFREQPEKKGLIRSFLLWNLLFLVFLIPSALAIGL